MDSPTSSKWFFEPTTPVEGHLHAVSRTILAQKTRYQRLEIFETLSYGMALALDGRIQSTVRDEFIYHEGLVHPAMLTHPAPERVMVVGGGEGATLREILRYASVRRALMVDIDAEVVEACRRHLPQFHRSSFDDPRVELRFEDARGWLERTDERFDVIVIDTTEPLEEGPAALLFTREFYTTVRDRLTETGVVGVQAGMTKVTELTGFSAVHRTLAHVFPVVAPYQTFCAAFGSPWGFVCASLGPDPRALSAQDVDRRISERVTGELLYWDGQTHLHAFALPKYLRGALEQEERVLEDANPLIQPL